jgi:hypothetical protein
LFHHGEKCEVGEAGRLSTALVFSKEHKCLQMGLLSRDPLLSSFLFFSYYGDRTQQMQKKGKKGRKEGREEGRKTPPTHNGHTS